MTPIKILWIDDEVELLKPHFLFLKGKGYLTSSCNNGQDALVMLKDEIFDVVLLDENMPGLGGLETLNEIKLKSPTLPVIMITKNEEEQIMEEAIGAKISDYLIKPVNPNQILLALKKLFEHKNLIAEKTIVNYQQAFRKISLSLNELHTHEDWSNFYIKMVYWEMELEDLEDLAMLEIFQNQMKEANRLFAKFIENNYKDWILHESGPLMSHQILKEKLFPILQKESDKTTLMLVIDNLRFDQWKMISQPEDTGRKIELYNLSTDPAESRNQFRPKHPQVIKLRNAIVEARKSIEESILGKDYPEENVHPQPPRIFWTELKEYQKFFPQWKNRPEYKSRLKKF